MPQGLNFWFENNSTNLSITAAPGAITLVKLIPVTSSFIHQSGISSGSGLTFSIVEQDCKIKIKET